MLRETDLERIAEVPIVCKRVAADVCARFCDLRRDLVVRRRELCVRDGLQCFDIIELQFCQKRRDDGFAVLLRGIAGDEVIDAAALHDALMEQAVRRRGLHQRPDLHTAAGLAEQRDVFRVAAEVCDIFVNPLQSCDHISVAGVAGILIFLAERGKIEIAEDIETVVE